MKDINPGIELSNNMKPNNYKQEFVYSHDDRHGPTNSKAKETPPYKEVMRMVCGH